MCRIWMFQVCSDRTKAEDGERRERKNTGRDRGPRQRGRGRGHAELIQSHSIFEQGPSEMMMKKRGRCLLLSPLGANWLCSQFIFLIYTGGFESERDAPSMGPSPIINIKKEKRETEEETKEILRSLERDNVSWAWGIFVRVLFTLPLRLGCSVMWTFPSAFVFFSL